MEYQKRIRRDLCILIYILSIFVCSFISNATSYASVSASALLSPSSLSSSQSLSQSQPQLQQSSPPTLLLSSHLPKTQSSSQKLFARSLVVPLAQQSIPTTESSPHQAEKNPSHEALSRQSLFETSTNNTSEFITNLPTLPSSSSLSPTSSSLISSSSSTTKSSKTIIQKANDTAKICGGIHIRNDLKNFEQLRGCKVINGPLTIALVANVNDPKDFENITFPILTEVRDYLLFFRVQNLTTLSKLFPNLSIIRGRELVSNYALIIYEMMHLQRIDLPNLTDILRGSVRIESNPNLCYASTINWDGISKHKFSPHFIKDNNAHCNNRCPDSCHPWIPLKISSSDLVQKLEGDVPELGADNNRSLFCWNNQDCHESCHDGDGRSFLRAPDGGCCSPLCAGGCFIRDRPDQCVACRYVFHKNRCVASCDSHMFEYEGQCLDQFQCEKVEKNETFFHQCGKGHEKKEFKAFRLPGDLYGKCQDYCSSGYEEDPTNKHRCKKCDKGKCRKICTPQDKNKLYMVTNVNSLRELTGCNVINGSLEISMKGGKNVLHELETVFQELEEISGYLKITRSYPILTLDFLHSLKVINGTSLDRGQYSLIIIDNPNLQELFAFHKNLADRKQLAIFGGKEEKGKIFVHLNPKLCPHKIDKLKQYAIVANWSEQDVSIHNNGDKEACNTVKLEVELVESLAHIASIRFQNFAAKLDDSRSLLYYLINFREAPNGNVTMFDGRDGCNSQNDVWTTIEEAPTKTSLNSSLDDYQQMLIPVQPATRYALYVKTFTILAGSPGALSDMIYFETAPDTPGIPRKLESIAIAHDSLSLSWLSPSKPNGNILHYIVSVSKTPELEDLPSLDVCDSIVSRDKITKTLTKNEPLQSSFSPSESNVTNPISSTLATSCSKSNSGKDLEIQENQVTFQDTIIDIVYLKLCPQSSSTKPQKEKKKRSIEHDLSVTESLSENSLPRKSTDPDPFSARTNVMNKSTNEVSQKYQHKSLDVIKFDKLSYKTEARVLAPLTKGEHQVKSLITGLEHFKLYTIEVVACHGEFTGGKTRTSGSYKKCSLEAVTQVRTKAIPENDKVNSSTIMFFAANETGGNTVTWEEPQNPNGLNLAFRARYRPKSVDVWNEVCINITAYNRDRGLTLSNVVSGEYVLSVQTISMYTEQRLWSDEIEFEIPQTNLLHTTAFWILIVGIAVALIVISVLFVTYHSKKNDNLVYASVNPDYVQYKPDEWEVDISKLTIDKQIGIGSFGMVHKGQLDTGKGSLDCAVKTVPPSSTAKQRMDFLREASIMKQFDTFHVVKLLGVISVTTPVYVIMEYMENGDLKEFLRNQRDLHQKQNKNLVDGIYLMAAQISDGMDYLASRKFVHRDLAARNCMVGKNCIVKIGDFGLTRDIYVNDYYRRDTQGRLPVRWMAPESLSDNICTSASDVWSYGIVLWEIVTFSAYPYAGLSNDEVIKRVTQGYTMPRPEHCPDKLFHLMEKCWRKNNKDRPTFSFITERLLPETEDKFYPNCFYRKPKVEGDSNAQSIPEDVNTGTESYPLLSWPSNRANGLTNGENHVNHKD